MHQETTTPLAADPRSRHDALDQIDKNHDATTRPRVGRIRILDSSVPQSHLVVSWSSYRSCDMLSGFLLFVEKGMHPNSGHVIAHDHAQLLPHGISCNRASVCNYKTASFLNRPAIGPPNTAPFRTVDIITSNHIRIPPPSTTVILRDLAYIPPTGPSTPYN